MYVHAIMSQILVTNLQQHSQKKRYIAGQYANTNIMRAQVMSGIQDRADAFVKQCMRSAGMSTDAYVGSVFILCMEIIWHVFRCPYIATRLTVPRIICFTLMGHILSNAKKIWD